jgi:hypothetical protein
MYDASYGGGILDSGQFIDFQSLRDNVTGEKVSLVKALVASRESKASDVRDRVYGLLGLTSDGSNLVPLPNYNLPPKDVFVELARNLWITKGHIYPSMLLIRSSER